MMAESDSETYEFDAPSHVVDLKSTEIDDKWFEEVGGTDLRTPLRPSQVSMEGDPLGAEVFPEKNVAPDIPVQSQSESPAPNIVTSWGTDTQGANRPRRKTANNSVQPRRVAKRKEMISCTATPPPKKIKASGFRKSERLISRAEPKAHEPASTSTSTEPLSSEDLEMERIRSLQREVALHRRQNEASYKAALAGNPPPKKMLISTTVPEEFHFNTDSRVKASATSDSSQKEVDFIHQLRQPSAATKMRRGATVPKPFNLSKGMKRKGEEPAAYVSMAQQVEQFQKRTPTRYHSRRTQERGPSPVKRNHPKLTQPHSPQLMTRQRGRPQATKSSAEVEAEELEQLQKFKIKPLELNKKMLEGAEALKKPAVKEPTVPEGFELEIEKRLQERQATKKPQEGEEKPHGFRAKPLPKKVLEGVSGLPEKKVPYPTVPESPAFALKKRIRLDRKVEEAKPPSPLKVPPVPHFGLPFVPRLPEKQQVEVCPFSFDQREQERRALKEKKLEELRNEEVPQFKAQLLPHFDTVVLPEKKKLEPTKPEPFRLLLDERGAVKSSRWEQMVKEEQKLQEEAAVFKARPNTVTHKVPFRPRKEGRSAVVVDAFELATERRAREWAEVERRHGEKEALRARMEEAQRQEEEQREREEIARLRQEQVHKAQPVRHYKPVAVKKSDVPLTVPESPNFSNRCRL
ncbi:targeting protein for Xklp2 isoform 2-T2 [Odontesthes bonariensis]|uniref:targeting protein for Xklp2 isoform X2 n=1 Tax=Odontesthes bonariensis TaxID=219752 RepID=UPI003F58FB80